MDDGVRAYIDAIEPAHRALFDRVHRLTLREYPDAVVVLSYKMPTYKVGSRRLHVGVWRHGVSLYGWDRDRAAGFIDRHPQLRTSKGTIRLRPADATAVTDDDLRILIRAALDD